MTDRGLPRPLRVLHLEDSARDAAMIRHHLELAGVACDVLHVDRRDAFEAALSQRTFDLIISDYTLPGYDGITALQRAQEVQPDVPVILISGTVGEEEAVKCLHIGATDYLLKGRLDRLAPAVRRAIGEATAQRIQRDTAEALRQRERTLSENERRMSFALAAARMGVWEIDLTTNRLTWSETMAPVFGMAQGEVPATKERFFALIHPDDRPAVKAAVERAIASCRDCVIEFRSIWPDGTTHWVHGRAQASYGPAGEPRCLLGIAMDIDDRKSLEDQLRQAQKLEAIGQLAGGVAHDFNNVLTVLLGFSELLSGNPSLDATALADLQEISKAAAQAAGLTRQLLAFSRKQILQPRVLDVNVLVAGVEPLLRQLLLENVGLSLTLEAHPAMVKMDPTQLRQILINLAVNAGDAMPGGGKLTIETSNVSLDDDYQEQHLPVAPGRFLRLVVRDNGAGMDEATRSRIFEPFFTTKEIGKGTGLGLATVYGIVKQSGGDIAVDTTPGRGTSFMVYLPQATAGADAAIERGSDEADSSRGTETILVVEDDEGVRRMARVTLERLGYRVLEADDPEKATHLAGQFTGPIDLLLSDVILPGSEGRPLFDRLAHTRPAMRVLYMSGYADERVRYVLHVEGTPFLQKPFAPRALAEKVREVLDLP